MAARQSTIIPVYATPICNWGDGSQCHIEVNEKTNTNRTEEKKLLQMVEGITFRWYGRVLQSDSPIITKAAGMYHSLVATSPFQQ
jgi:hypothetical protein